MKLAMSDIDEEEDRVIHLYGHPTVCDICGIPHMGSVAQFRFIKLRDSDTFSRRAFNPIAALDSGQTTIRHWGKLSQPYLS